MGTSAGCGRRRVPRLLAFNRSYHPDLGATGQLLTQLGEDLVDRFGWEVVVVAGRAAAPPGGGSRGRWTPIARERINGVGVLRANGTALAKGRVAGRVA